MINDDLWLAIYDLYELLQDEVNDEDSYQRYFEKHPIVFEVLGYDTFCSFENRSPNKLPYDNERGYRPEPDFICGKKLVGEITIFELKTPFQPNPTTSRSDGNRKKFRATVESHISQATEYVETIRERESARKVVQDTLQLPKISSYKIVVVYGQSDASDSTEVVRLADQRKIETKVIPYDDLRDQLIKQHVISRGETGGRDGYCSCSHIVISPNQINEKAYVFDIGSLSKDRISMYVENKNLVFECTGTYGDIYRFPNSFTPNIPLYVRIEFSNDESGTFFSVNIDNNDVDLRFGKKPLEIAPNFDSFFMGSNLDGQSGCCFGMIEHYAISKTMKIMDKLGSFHYFKRKTAGPIKFVEFDGTTFLHSKTTIKPK